MGWGKTRPAHSFPPPLSSNLSIYLSVLGLNHSYTEYEHSWLTYLKEKFKLQAFSQMILLNRGWGKTAPAHSFPSLLFSNLSIYLSVFSRLKPFFFLRVGFCPPCQIKQWAFVQSDIVQWAFVLVGFCPSGLLSVPHYPPPPPPPNWKIVDGT